MVGAVIAGKYRIESLIGSGGMANVYKAYDEQEGRTVAIKMLKAEHREDTEFLRRFEREAKAVITLSHPNIVQSYDVGVDEKGVSFIVLEYVHGQTLKEYIKSKTYLSPKETVNIASKVLDALGHAHEMGIIHRDVKPQNVIISDDGLVKLTDFGIARDATSTTRTFAGTNVIGSAHYISPEQAQFLETRKFQINEIARIFRVPPHMVGDLEKSSFSNIEQQSLEFVKYTLEPWLMRWEQSMARRLFSDSEKREYFIRFNVEGLLRGDYASRMNGYAVARQNGWMSANDIRELENLDRIPAEEGGDLYLVNGSMTKLSDAGAFAGAAATNPTETEEQTSE